MRALANTHTHTHTHTHRQSPQQRGGTGDKLRVSAAARPRSGEKPVAKSSHPGGLASGSAAAVASAALEVQCVRVCVFVC
jgi:hypothetical protein